MRPPISGKQARAAATFEGSPVEDPPGFANGGSGEEGVLGSTGSAMMNLDKILRETVK